MRKQNKEVCSEGYNKGFELWNLRKFKKVRTNRTKNMPLSKDLSERNGNSGNVYLAQ